MGNEIAKVNGVAFGSIGKVNGVTASNINHINGKDLVISVDYSIQDMSNEDALNSGRSWGLSNSYHPGTGQMVFVYGDDGNSSYGTVRTVLLSGTTAYMGDEYVYATVTTYLTQLIYDSTNNRMALCSMDTTNYNEIAVYSFTVGSPNSATDPYNIAASDFNDTGGSSSKHIPDANDGSNYTQTCGANIFDYNPNYDTYSIMFERDSDDANCIRLCKMSSTGAWSSGSEVVFENSANDLFTSCYESSIQRTVLRFNTGANNSSPSGSKWDVVKQSGTDNLTITLAGSFNAAGKLPNAPSSAGRLMAYMPNAGTSNNGFLMYCGGISSANELYYTRLTGNDGSGYSVDVQGDVGNYGYLGGTNGNSTWCGVYYVKGRDRMIAFTFNVETAYNDGTDIKTLMGHIIEWGGADDEDAMNDVAIGNQSTYPAYGGRVRFVETATTGSQMRPYDTYGDCAINDRTAFGAMLGAVTNYSNSKTQFTRLIEVGDRGTTGATP